LTTILPPLLRRLDTVAATVGPSLAAEVLAAAERISRLNADPGINAPAIQRECERLRALAQAHAT
jgi:hypothetical protein